MNKTKITRITIDLDTKDEKVLEHCIFVIKKYGFDKDIEVKKSPGGKGHHVVAFSETGLPLHELLMVRKLAGDDHIRIYLDSKAHRAINVLFDHKEKRTIPVGELLGG